MSIIHSQDNRAELMRATIEHGAVLSPPSLLYYCTYVHNNQSGAIATRLPIIDFDFKLKQSYSK